MNWSAQWVLEVVSWVCAFWQVIFLVSYVRHVYPLRRIGDVLAPPVRLTFAYHLIVAAIVVTIAVNTYIRLEQGVQPIVTTYILTALIAALACATYLFNESYRFQLKLAAQHRAINNP